MRLNYFGPYTETFLNRTDLLIDAGSEFTLDVEATYKLMEQVELSIGAENVLNNFPDENPTPASERNIQNRRRWALRAVSTTSASAMFFELREPARGRCQSKSA